MRTAKKERKRLWKPVRRRKELAGGTSKETQQISEWQCGVCDHLYEDETEEEEVSAASVSYGTMWGVCI